MIRNIFTLVLNDFAVLFKNKAIFLVIFVPLFIVISLKLTDRSAQSFQKIKIGIIENEIYPPVIMKYMAAADKTFTIYRVSVKEGRQRLKDRKLDGILIKHTNEPAGLTLLVLRKESIQSALIIESLSALQKSATGAARNWITDIKPLQDGEVQKQMLSAWILMVVLLVSFVIIPAQVAEEKEKNQLIGLLQTPMRETEWLFAKLLSGVILINVAVTILHFSVGFSAVKSPGYIIFLEAGSLCFTCAGITLGFLCRTQATARTLGVLVYIALLIPPALSDFSVKLNTLASFIPSYQLYNPLRSIILENSGMSNFFREGIILLLFGVGAFTFSYTLMKRRWLM